MTNDETRIDKPLPFWLAASPFVLLIALFATGTLYMNAGESLIVLSMLGAATFASAIAVRQGKGWDDIQQSAIDKIASVFPVILILLSIGALIGAWVFSGTIPMIVWVGLQIINPAYIVVTAFFAAALMSIVTGTSWGSAGTIGVALMGIATVIDAPLAIVAGAIVSGAYFGDKMSPLSDSTNIAALGAGADLYGHIRHMTYTAFPSFVVATLVFTFVQTGDGQSDGGLSEAANVMIRDIEMVFRLEWFALLPTIVIFFAIARKWPPVLGIVAAAASGAVIGILGQGFDINDGLLALTTGFNVEMIHSANSASLSEPFLQLVNRGGVYSIVNTLVVIIAAFILAGAMDASGALKILVNGLLKSAKSVFSLVATTMASSLVMLSLTSHGGVTCLIVGGLYQDAYRERKLAAVNLSRSLEDSVTLMDPLMPWTVSALFMANTLGVPTLEYFPWAIFCLGGPIFSLLLAAQYQRSKFGLRPL